VGRGGGIFGEDSISCGEGSMMKIWYSKYEGGLWNEVEVPYYRLELVKHVTNKKNWMDSESYIHRGGAKERTIIKDVDGNLILAHAIAFDNPVPAHSDPLVWDSFFRDFRQFYHTSLDGHNTFDYVNDIRPNR
jgi:hypothetical protein